MKFIPCLAVTECKIPLLVDKESPRDDSNLNNVDIINKKIIVLVRCIFVNAMNIRLHDSIGPFVQCSTSGNDCYFRWKTPVSQSYDDMAHKVRLNGS